MAEWREVFIDLELTVRIRYRRSEAPPPFRYAITLETLVDNEWTTARLWDNADDADDHHEHEYTRHEGKKPPKRLSFASTNEAMAAAIREAGTKWPMMIRQWSDEQ